jgi:hypothetical protein
MFCRKSKFLLIYQSAQLKLRSGQSSSQLSSAQVSWNIGQLISSLGSSSSAQLTAQLKLRVTELMSITADFIVLSIIIKDLGNCINASFFKIYCKLN